MEESKFHLSILIFALLVFACGNNNSNNNQNSSSYSKSNYENGMDELDKHNYDQARTYFNKIGKKDKNYGEAISKINYINGCLEFNKKNYSEALEYFNKVTSSDIYIYKANEYIKIIDFAINKMDYAFSLYENNLMDSSLKILNNIAFGDFDYNKSQELKDLIKATIYKNRNNYDSAIVLLENMSQESIYSNISESILDEIKINLDTSNFNKGIVLLGLLKIDSSKHYFNKVNYLTELIESSKEYLDSIDKYKDTLMYAKLIYYLEKTDIDSSIIIFEKSSTSSIYYDDSKFKINETSKRKDKEKVYGALYLATPLIFLGLIILYLTLQRKRNNKALLELRNLIISSDFELNSNIEHLVYNISTINRISEKSLVVSLFYILSVDIVGNNKYFMNSDIYNNRIDLFKRFIEKYKYSTKELTNILQSKNIN